MKYLAAYALLSLSGKKDICTFFSSSQPLLTLKKSSDLPTATLPTLTSTDWSKLWRVKMSTSWLQVDSPKSETQVQLQLEMPVQSQPPNKRKNNNQRNKHQKRKSNQRSKKKKTWDLVEDFSIDHAHCIFISFTQSSFNSFSLPHFLYLWLYFKANYNIFQKLKKI